MRLVSLLIPILLLVFWLWMFWDMANNDDIPANTGSPLGWPPASRTQWTILFIILNIFAAVVYFVEVYQRRRA